MKKNSRLQIGAGTVALLLATLSPAFGQTTTTTTTDTNPPTANPPAAAPATTAPAPTTSQVNDQTIQMAPLVVKGEQASLASAQELKMDSESIEDSIVADDIDKLPDVNVSYALERVTGVQVAHVFAGVGGNGAVTIDGLTQVENTIDGREVFTAGGTSGGGVGNGQRTFDYSDIPSALVSGIDVYKSSAANQLDGGLGGIIDVRLHKPFDFDGPQVAVTVGTTESTLNNDSKPNYNVLVSDTEKTSIGKIGFLVDATYNVQPWREDNIGVGNPTSAPTAATGAPAALIASGYTTDTGQGTFQTTGVNGVVQWAPGPNLNLYAGYTFEQWWNIEDQHEFSVGLSSATVVPGSAQMFAGSGTAVESAAFTNVTATTYDIIRDLTDRSREYYIGGAWNSGDLTIKLDVSRYDTANGFYNNGIYDSAALPGFNYNLGGTIAAGVVTGASLLDPSIYKPAGGQVYTRLDPSTGYETAGKLDGEYEIHNSFLTAIDAGVRYAGTEDDNGTTGLYLGSYTFPASAASINQFPGGWTAEPVENFFSGYKEPTVFQYLAAEASNLRNANETLAQFGDTTTTLATDGSINPLSLFHIDESTTAVYLMPKFAGNLGGLTYDGNIGLRAVQTTDDLGGFQTVTPASIAPGGVAVLGPLHLSDTYTDWLPSLNYRLKLTDSLFFRVAASKTITRPNFNEISPSLTLNENPITPSLDTGSQGNPNLQPMRSDNVDISLEQYFNKSTSVFVSALYKDVSGFPESITNPETYGGVTYQVSTYANLNAATIKGVEAGYQQFFSFLPAPFDGLGFQGNFTHVDSTTPSSIQGYNIPLTNLSRNSYNLIGMYEKGPFSARLAYNWRDKYVTGVSSFVGVGLLPQLVRSYGDLDASLNYDVTKNIEFTVQGTNLTNTLRFQYWGSPNVPSNLYLDGMYLTASVTLRF
jgi:iron complex outermembrane recepter protein